MGARLGPGGRNLVVRFGRALGYPETEGQHPVSGAAPRVPSGLFHLDEETVKPGCYMSVAIL